MKNIAKLAVFILCAALPAMAEPVASTSTNCGSYAVTTNSTVVLPALSQYAKRVSLLVRNPAGSATVWVRMGAAATTNNAIPLAGGEVYVESLPVVDNRSLNILATSNGVVYVEEKFE